MPGSMLFDKCEQLDGSDSCRQMLMTNGEMTSEQPGKARMTVGWMLHCCLNFVSQFQESFGQAIISAPVHECGRRVGRVPRSWEGNTT